MSEFIKQAAYDAGYREARRVLQEQADSYAKAQADRREQERARADRVLVRSVVVIWIVGFAVGVSVGAML